MIKALSFQHCLSIEQITLRDCEMIFSQAQTYWRAQKHVRVDADISTAGMFFVEPSVRTLASFSLALSRLSMTAIPLSSDIAGSQIKGEPLADKLRYLESMGLRMCIVRHPQPRWWESFLSQPSQLALINAGDGVGEHPTQVLGDIFTLKQHIVSLSTSSIAIVGDVRHSRVARSLVKLLHLLGVSDIRVIAPTEMLPEDIDAWPVRVFDAINAGLNGVDVVYGLRVQKERFSAGFSFDEAHYIRFYQVTLERLSAAKDQCLLCHPGPVNWGLEFDSALSTYPQLLCYQQASLGVYVRMALIAFMCNTDYICTQKVGEMH